MKQLTIAIDGLTGTGKGTTAKGVATLLGYTYLDTGAMYRCATLHAIKHNLLDADDEKKAAMIDDLDITFKQTDTGQRTYLHDIDVEDEIRATDLALQMKPIVSCLPLRKKMIALQASYKETGGIVCDGRDAGTHIFPDAELKVFMLCDPEVRAIRRHAQLENQGLPADLEKIRTEIAHRDEVDYLGPNAVNKKAPDARELDTTHLSIQEQVQQVVDRAQEIG